MNRTLVALALIVSWSAFAWTPPQDPDPQAILNEATADRMAGRYEDALQKHLWIHRESTKRDPAFHGVRASFALGHWAHLGAKYPPALDALRAIREQAAHDVRDGTNTLAAFADLVAIDRELDNPPLDAVQLFMLIESRDPALARRAFVIAREPIAEEKRFDIAGRYIDPARELQNAREMHADLAKPRFAPMPFDSNGMADRFFAERVGKLVALLVQVNRKAEADRIVATAYETASTPEVKAVLGRALEGQAPEPIVTKETRRMLKDLMP